MSRRAKIVFVSALTFVRMPLILVFLAVNLLLIRQQQDGSWHLGTEATRPFWFSVALYAMVLSTLTDLFDGYFARRFQVVTRMGAYMDPLTDKIFYLVSFPTLVFLAALRPQEMLHGRLLLTLTVVFLMRDQWISFLRSLGALHGVDAKANWSGKARTIVSFPTICFVYWYLEVPGDWRLQFPQWFIYALESASLVINLISIWVYTVYYLPWMRKELEP